MQGQVQYEEEEEVFEDSMDYGNQHASGDIIYNQQESGQLRCSGLAPEVWCGRTTRLQR